MLEDVVERDKIFSRIIIQLYISGDLTVNFGRHDSGLGPLDRKPNSSTEFLFLFRSRSIIMSMTWMQIWLF